MGNVFDIWPAFDQSAPHKIEVATYAAIDMAQQKVYPSVLNSRKQAQRKLCIRKLRKHFEKIDTVSCKISADFATLIVRCESVFKSSANLGNRRHGIGRVLRIGLKFNLAGRMRCQYFEKPKILFLVFKFGDD